MKEIVYENNEIAISRTEYDKLIKASLIAEKLTSLIKDRREHYHGITYDETRMLYEFLFSKEREGE